MRVFKNVKTYLTGRGIITTDISFDDKIRALGNITDSEEIFIPGECMVVPGFIDEHVHGAGGAAVMDGKSESLKTMSIQLAKSGTTSFLATTDTNSKEIIAKALNTVSDYMTKDSPFGAEILGIHMEGPFISAKYKGAMREDLIIPPSIKDFNFFEKESGNKIKMITLAPETDKTDKLIVYLNKKGITVSIGHTDSGYKDIVKAIGRGATCITHTFNAQKPLHHREIGTVGGALLCDEIYTEIISDGIHVSFPAIKLLLKNKPKNKVILITDALKAQGLPKGMSDLSGRPIVIEDCARLTDGTLAGSVMPINKMLLNLVQNVGVKIETAIDFATINPAQNIKVATKKGSIEIGKDADFAVIDKDFNVFMTVRKGIIIYAAECGS